MRVKWRPSSAGSRAGSAGGATVRETKNVNLDAFCPKPRLSQATCDALVRLGSAGPCQKPRVVGQRSLPRHRLGVIHPIPYGKETAHVYQLLWDAAAEASATHYQFELSGIDREPQYVEYSPRNGHFHWHDDYSHESRDAPRKLTIIVQLSGAREYAGGDFEIFGSRIKKAPRARGTILCLPSFVPHRVTAVTSGVRRVVVAWISGPRLR